MWLWKDFSNEVCTAPGHVVRDDPATAIIDVAAREHADLVIVGSRGLRGVQRFLRGSVSARVAANALVSVPIVHNPGEATPTSGDEGFSPQSQRR